jgi:hypothetical protein
MSDADIFKLTNSRNGYRTWVVILSILLLLNIALISIIILFELLRLAANTDLINTLFNFISYSTNFISLLLAIIAIWISFQYNSTSNSLNERTEALLYEIRDESKKLSSVVMPELSKYGDVARNAFEEFVGIVLDAKKAKNPDPGESK